MDVDLVALVGLSAADASCLQSLKSLMAGNQDAVINAFYGRILAFPRFKAMIEKACEREGRDIGQRPPHQ